MSRTDISHYIETFVKNHLSLIDNEYEEERKTYDYENKKLDVVSLERQGILVRNLTIINVAAEYGSWVVEFEKTGNQIRRQPIITNGDLVSIWTYCNEKKSCIASGCVMHIAEKIKVSLDTRHSPSEWDRDQSYFIMKTMSEITTNRMKSALQKLAHMKHGYDRCFTIVEHLFGNVPLQRSALAPKFLNKNKELKFINTHLHSDQKEAVIFALEQNNLAIIHGPPGTGKTTTLVEIILHLVNSGEKVLVCAPSNVAVDTLLEKLEKIKSKVIRVGNTARMLEGSKNYSLDAAVLSRDDAPIVLEVKKQLERCRQLSSKATTKEDQKALYNEMKDLKNEIRERQNKVHREVLKNASVVLTTLVSAAEERDLGHLPDEHFSILIIDECSQAIEAACWIPIPRVPKVIMAGDHLQLPPTIKSKAAMEGGLGISLMERAINKLGESCYKLLTHQFRMHSSIMSWVSKLYGGKLEADDSVANRLLKDLPGVNETEETETPLLLIDTAGCGLSEDECRGSKCNDGEADIVALIVNRLVSAGVPTNMIAVITPYSLQEMCIKFKLNSHPGVEVRTVDGFQGREKTAVIISLVRSNKEKELGFVADKRRLNVAISRAQSFLAVIGDSCTVGSDETIRSIFKHIKDNGISCSAHEFTEEISAWDIPKYNPENTDASKTQKKNKPEEKSVKISKKNVERPQIINGKKGSMRTSGVRSKRQTSVLEKMENSFGGLENSGGKEKAKNGSQEENNEDSGEISSHDSEVNYSDPRSEPKVCPEDKQTVTGATTEDHMPSEKNSSESDTPALQVQAHKAGHGKDKHNRKQNDVKVSKTSCKKFQNLQKLDNTDASKNVEKGKGDFTCNVGDCSADTKLDHCEDCGEKFCVTHVLPADHECSDSERRLKQGCRQGQKQKVVKAPKKSGKRAENLQKSNNKDDDFQVMEDYVKEITTCNMGGCDTNIKLFPQICEHCRKTYCLSHLLPEIHGCGDAAKRSARHNFRHTQPPKTGEREKKVAIMKLRRKVAEMAADRKPQKKK